ncbi:hypothetical protein SDC9_142129 [bioreactor metagenome]|uniref:Uncharacterized protein n=1 Tax=bioreactor metagenome TaxID=1076179 RepID=A0A645DZM6_9ZZZZ
MGESPLYCPVCPVRALELPVLVFSLQRFEHDIRGVACIADPALLHARGKMAAACTPFGEKIHGTVRHLLQPHPAALMAAKPAGLLLGLPAQRIVLVHLFGAEVSCALGGIGSRRGNAAVGTVVGPRGLVLPVPVRQRGDKSSKPVDFLQELCVLLCKLLFRSVQGVNDLVLGCDGGNECFDLSRKLGVVAGFNDLVLGCDGIPKGFDESKKSLDVNRKISGDV